MWDSNHAGNPNQSRDSRSYGQQPIASTSAGNNSRANPSNQHSTTSASSSHRSNPQSMNHRQSGSSSSSFRNPHPLPQRPQTSIPPPHPNQLFTPHQASRQSHPLPNPPIRDGWNRSDSSRVQQAGQSSRVAGDQSDRNRDNVLAKETQSLGINGRDKGGSLNQLETKALSLEIDSDLDQEIDMELDSDPVDHSPIQLSRPHPLPSRSTATTSNPASTSTLPPRPNQSTSKQPREARDSNNDRQSTTSRPTESTDRPTSTSVNGQVQSSSSSIIQPQPQTITTNTTTTTSSISIPTNIDPTRISISNPNSTSSNLAIQTSNYRTGLIYSTEMMKHFNSNDQNHPESPERIFKIFTVLKKYGFVERMKRINIREAIKQEVALIHVNHVWEGAEASACEFGVKSRWLGT